MHPRCGGYAVLREEFGDGAVLPLGRGAVVAPDVQKQCVVRVAESIQFIDDPAHLHVAVFRESGRDFHQPALEGFFVFGDVIPGLHPLIALGELTVRRNPAFLFGALKHPLPVSVPTVEMARIAVGPFLHDVVRPV